MPLIRAPPASAPRDGTLANSSRKPGSAVRSDHATPNGISSGGWMPRCASSPSALTSPVVPTRSVSRGVVTRRPKSAVTSVTAPAPPDAEARQLGDVAPEEERRRPVRDDPGLAAEERQRIEVVGAGDEPAEEARDVDAHHVGDALVAAERRDLAQHPVAVRLRGRRSRFFASRRAWRSACWQVGGSVCPGVRVFGTAAQSPSDQTFSSPSTRSVASTRTRPGRRAAGRTRAATATPYAGRPDERAGRHGRPVREDGALAVVGRQRLADVDLDAPLLELAARRRCRACGGCRPGSSEPHRRAPTAA